MSVVIVIWHSIAKSQEHKDKEGIDFLQDVDNWSLYLGIILWNM